MYIYCDNAAQKPLLNNVKEMIRTFLDCDFCNPSAVYSDGRRTRKFIEEARGKIAQSINADSEEIIFTSGSTEAINWIFNAWNGKIITTPIEHKAILKNHLCYSNLYLRISNAGIVDLENLDTICCPHSLIVIGYINNEIGVIQPLKEIIEIAHKHNAFVFCDATQAIGSIPIDVQELDVDFMCFSAQKMGALAGCGFLYKKKNIKIAPLFLGGSQEQELRAGTENVCGILAMTTAMAVITKDIEVRSKNLLKKRDKILCGLFLIPKIHLNGDLNNRVASNINVSFEGINGESLALLLDLDGICVSTGSACNSESIEPSHVLKAIGRSDDLARASIRISIGEDITDEQIDYLIERIEFHVQELRDLSPQWKEIMNGDN